jgi:hypothetical protein
MERKRCVGAFDQWCLFLSVILVSLDIHGWNRKFKRNMNEAKIDYGATYYELRNLLALCFCVVVLPGKKTTQARKAICLHVKQ